MPRPTDPRVARDQFLTAVAATLSEDDRAILLASLVTVCAIDEERHPRDVAAELGTLGEWGTPEEWDAGERRATERGVRNARRFYSEPVIALRPRRAQG